MHLLNEQNIFIFLIQLFLLLALARGLGDIFRIWKQPSVTAEILVGIFLGPTILGRLFPDFQQYVFPADPVQINMLQTVAWLGLFFFLLESGLEMDISSAWNQRLDAVKIAVVGVIVPLVISYVCFLFLPDKYLIDPSRREVFAFFMATVMAITAIPVVTRALYDLDLLKTDLGFLIIAAHSINDVLGWLTFTLVLVFYTTGVFAWATVGIIFTATIVFVALCLTLGRHWTKKTIAIIQKKQMPEPSTSLTFVCLLGLFCGAITQKIGIHALFGFFLAGIMASGATTLSERTRQVISQMVFAIFIPLFFANIGLHLDFIKNFDLFLVVFFTALGIGVKFLGGWLGVLTTKISATDRLSIAIAHTPGGTMEIVVGTIALQYGLISEAVFVSIVFSAIFSSVILGPWLKHSIDRRKKLGIADYLSKTAVMIRLRGRNKSEIIEELSRVASLESIGHTADDIQDAVMSRENVMGTAMENGIAIPHARMPVLRAPLIVFGRSVNGVDWNSPDGKLTHYIFMILTLDGDDDAQIQILRTLARMMSDEKLRENLMQARESEEVWKILHNGITKAHS